MKTEAQINNRIKALRQFKTNTKIFFITDILNKR